MDKMDALSLGKTTAYLIGELHALGVTYQSIADTVGVTWMTVHRWTTGENRPRPAGPINQVLGQMLTSKQCENAANSAEKTVVLV